MADPKGISGEANGDTDAATLALWMAKYGAGLRTFFARRVGASEADDLVQEVFLSLQRRGADAGADVQDVEAFLFTVARRALVNRYRRDKGHLLEALTENSPDGADDLSPERALAAKQQLQRAIVAILNLPPKMRAVFEFHRFERLSYSAIAARMGISKATVQGYMERALARIAEDVDLEI